MKDEILELEDNQLLIKFVGYDQKLEKLKFEVYGKLDLINHLKEFRNKDKIHERYKMLKALSKQIVLAFFKEKQNYEKLKEYIKQYVNDLNIYDMLELKNKDIELMFDDVNVYSEYFVIKCNAYLIKKK